MKENVIKNWEIDPEMLYEGYYLAQRAGDASRSPYFLKEDEDITDLDLYDFPHVDSYEIAVGAAWPSLSAFPGPSGSFDPSKYRIGMVCSMILNGTQTDEGPLYIYIYSERERTLGSNPRIVLTLDSGDELVVYLPSGLSIGECSLIAFWVTEDGSTYWTNTSTPHDTIQASSVFSMDSFYAIRWEDDNLSRGAFDARLYAAGGAGYEEDADSPAVDAGSKDFLNGGTTSTNCTLATDVFLPNTPDNEAPNKLGEMDNKDSSGDIVPWEDPSSPMYGTGDDLDMGYHYWGACYDDSDNYTTNPSNYYRVISLRHPKDGCGEIDYEVDEETLTFHPDIGSLKKIAIASSEYNNTEKTISCFFTNVIRDDGMEGDYHGLVCYKRFRGGDGSYGVVDYFKSHSNDILNFKCMAMTTGDDASGTMGKPIYLIVFSYCVNDAEYYNGETIDVYRYEPVSDNWVKVIKMGVPNEMVHFTDVALAAYDEDLVLFWTQHNDVNGKYYIKGYRLEDAATTPGVKLLDQPVSYIIETSNIIQNISADWDPDISKPRISWTQKDGSDGNFDIWAAQVTFNAATQQPDGYTQRYRIFSDAQNNDARNPTIVVNLNNPSNEYYEAFTALTCNTEVIRVDLESINGVDSWQTPVTVIDEGSALVGDTSISYRAFGNPKHIWNDGIQIFTDTEVLQPCNYMHPKDVKLCTNKLDKVNLFTSFREETGDDQKIIIQQLEP